MTTESIQYKVAEIRRLINSSSNQSEITSLIIERDNLLKKLQATKKTISEEEAFENMRNAMLY